MSTIKKTTTTYAEKNGIIDINPNQLNIVSDLNGQYWDLGEEHTYIMGEGLIRNDKTGEIVKTFSNNTKLDEAKIKEAELKAEELKNLFF